MDSTPPPTTATANGGSLTQSSIAWISVWPNGRHWLNGNDFQVSGLSISDAGGAGTVTTQVGVDMPIMIRGGTNIGFRFMAQVGQTLTGGGGTPISSLFAGTTTW